MADAYGSVTKGSLKLKGVEDGGIKKKKKKKNKSKKVEDIVKSIAKREGTSSPKENFEEEEKDKRTPAQIAFDKMQEKRATERILKKAEKTHKQRVEKFNEYLDELTEHYDIPKVSWTK